MKTSLLVLAMAGAAASTLADTQRQHGAHEHGAATLLVASDGSELVITLDSPAYNLFGFEHAPSTAEQKATVEDGIARLKAGVDLFAFNRAANCALEDAHVETELMSGEDHAHDDHGHDEAHHDEHEHDDHGHDEAHHDEHEHEHEHEHEAEGGHSDVIVEWHFHCDNPLELADIEVGLFGAFPNLTDLDAQYLLDTAQGAEELSPGKTLLRF